MWMNTLYYLIQKFKKPDFLDNKKIVNDDTISNKEMNKIIDNNVKEEKELPIDNSNKNVTWVPITKWSDCTKSCGGGKSYLKRLCIIPEDVTEKCEGENILERDCNLDPCDTFNKEIAKYNITKAESIYRINYMPVSKRPMRYERCIIKEGDLALYIDEGTIKGAKIPVRVIINKNTLTAYANDNYDSIILSHSLSSITGLRKYDKDETEACFEIEEKKRKTILCAFAGSSDKGVVELAREWQIDLLDFIKKCTDSYSPDLDYVEIKDKNLENDFQNSFDFYQEKEKDEMEKIIQKTQQIALKALEKELKVENLIEKEEELKHKKLETEIFQRLEKVKLQKDLINKALSERKKQADVFANKLAIRKKIKQLTEQVKREVLKIREDLRARILAKQRDESRKRTIVIDKINDLKKDISNNLMKASKDGNIEECNPYRKNEDIIKYCKVNYGDDISKMKRCVEGDKFCYMCCEYEFGELHLEKRSACYSDCDDFLVYKNDSKDDENKKSGDLEGMPTIKKENKTAKTEIKVVKEKYFLKKKPNNFPNSQFLNLMQTKEENTSGNKQDLDKLIEEAKKKELLLNIKEELLI